MENFAAKKKTCKYTKRREEKVCGFFFVCICSPPWMFLLNLKRCKEIIMCVCINWNDGTVRRFEALIWACFTCPCREEKKKNQERHKIIIFQNSYTTELRTVSLVLFAHRSYAELSQHKITYEIGKTTRKMLYSSILSFKTNQPASFSPPTQYLSQATHLVISEVHW